MAAVPGGVKEVPGVAADDGEADPAYVAAISRLQARGRFGMRLGLGRTRALLRRLGDPQAILKGVLIGGTNGKGSTQALVGSVLRAAGYRAGQMPKPHLVSYRERIRVDGEPIAVADFVPLLERVNDAADGVERRLGALTEFELLTAAGFAWFAEMGVEVGVVEVGIGGRLDATNVWQGGVSAITNVALDHIDVLGNSLTAIAAEKAQIIKRGDHAAVTAAAEPGLGVIRRRAVRVSVPLVVVEPLPIEALDWSGLQVRAPGGSRLKIGLLGRHQAANAAVALAILDALAAAGVARAPASAVQRGLAEARWPGRLELLHGAGSPDVLLDGAHNPHGMAALAGTLAELLPARAGRSVTVLVGVIANHWQPGMLGPLRAALPHARMLATNVPGTQNSLPPRQLAAAWGDGATVIDDPEAALERALGEAAAGGGMLLICGSLYLVGHLRGLLIEGGMIAAEN